MMKKPSGCAGCPLQHKGIGFVPDKVSLTPDYVMVGEAPGKNEVQQNEPFVGKAGHVLKQWLMHVVPEIRLAYERNKVTFANTLRCLPPEIQGRPYPKGQEKLDAEAQCRQYDNFGSAKTLILFGESPQRMFFREELEAEDKESREQGRDVKGVTGRIGREVERDGRRYVFAPHPAYILRQPALVEHGQRSLHIAANVERMVEPEYFSWHGAMEVLL